MFPVEVGLAEQPVLQLGAGTWWSMVKQTTTSKLPTSKGSAVASPW
jgi:hypothetical protein